MSGPWTLRRQRLERMPVSRPAGPPPAAPPRPSPSWTGDVELYGLAAAFHSEDPAVMELVQRITTARWFVRTGRVPAPVEQRLLNELARGSSAPAAAWLDAWTSVHDVTGVLDQHALAEVEQLGEHARQTALRGGRGIELDTAVKLCAHAVPAHAAPREPVDPETMYVATRIATFWLSNLVAVTIAGTEPGPIDAAGQLLLWGRLPLGVDDAGWWVL